MALVVITATAHRKRPGESESGCGDDHVTVPKMNPGDGHTVEQRVMDETCCGQTSIVT